MAKVYQLVLLALGAVAFGSTGAAANAAVVDSIKPVDPGTGLRLCGPVCAIYCQYGNVLDARGCPTCQCKPKPHCPSVNCSYSCPNGYLVDANDCKTCKCNCPVIDCARCPEPKVNQVITNPVTGCSTGCSCQCPPPPKCAACSYGSDPVQGAVCPTCPVCRPRPTCPVSNCLFIKCASLITETDGNGCTKCRCGPKPQCSSVNCSHSCPMGYLVDANGCKTCKCNCSAINSGVNCLCPSPKIPQIVRNPVTGCATGCSCRCPAVNCTACPRPQISVPIKNPTTNCTTGCSCKCPPLPKCPLCRYGSYPPTSSICPSCPKCKPKPQCPSVNCSYSCPNGFLFDANGCKTCKCKCPPPPPCAPCLYGSDPVQGAVCPTCPVCRPQPTCPVSNCLFIKCASLITETDGNGCRKCRCGCPLVACAACPSPQISEPIINPATNCTTGCRCKCPPSPLCPSCAYGSYPAADGICPSCPTCKPRPICPSVYCSKKCQYGYLVDANGCSTCNCTCPTPVYKPQLCAGVRVGNFCRSDADCNGSRCCAGDCGGTYCLDG